jgi:hypothetical protein
MSIATGTAIAIGVGAAGAAVGGATSMAGAGKAKDASEYAAQLQAQSEANSLAFNKQVYADTTANQKPFVQAGQQAINQLAAQTAPGGSLAQQWNTPFSFTGVDLQNDPAYQFDFDQGTKAIQKSAAAGGSLVSGGALKDLNDYAQGYASNQFQQSYQNALTNYQQAYNVFQQNQSNTFNREAAVAGIGGSSAGRLRATRRGGWCGRHGRRGECPH